MKSLFTLLICLFCFSIGQAQLNCTDCPTSDFVNGILTSELEVINPGPDDITQNPLVQVCVTLQHSWLSDVAITLESPAGLNYMLMGDDDNQWGGCNSGAEDGANVCFVLGTDTPLTSGEPYGMFCSGNGAYCLDGDFNVTCGPQAVSPDGLAGPAPNCDLLDYSNIGTISGIWTLRVYCVCQIGEFSLLENWSLYFQDGSSLTTGNGTSSCNSYAGSGFNNPIAAACNADSDVINFVPVVESGLEVPISNDYNYGLIMCESNSPAIIGFFPETFFINTELFPAGSFDFYGISYHNNSLSNINSLINSGYSVIDLNTVMGSSNLHCYDLTDGYKSVEIDQVEYFTEEFTLCNGDALEIYGLMIDAPGNYNASFNNGGACDDEISLMVLPDDGTSFEQVYPRVCSGESATMTAENGVSFLWTGPNGFTSTNQTISINNADENDSGLYTCEVTTTAGCIHEQKTDLSFRCETRTVNILYGESLTLDFDQVVSTSDECTDNSENIVVTGISNQSVILMAQNEGHEQVCFQAYEDGLLKNFTYDITVEAIVNTSEPQIELSISPNPAKDTVLIQTPGISLENISIFDISGKSIYSNNVASDQITIDVDHLQSGIYLVRLSTEVGVLHRKLMIQ